MMLEVVAAMTEEWNDTRSMKRREQRYVTEIRSTCLTKRSPRSGEFARLR
jgi:hypothetical protein